MLDHAGGLPHVVVSGALWLLLAPLLAGLVLRILAYVGFGRDARVRALAWRTSFARWLGVVCIGFETGVALTYALVLFRAPEPGREYVEYLTSGLRVGAVDANVGLFLDWASADACALACVLVFAVAVCVAARPAQERPPAVWACLELALAGALVSFLGDGLIAVAIGWTLAIGAGAGLAGRKDPRAGVLGAMRGAVALSALAFGGAWLFWASAGTWHGREYSVRQTMGFSAVHSAPSLPGHGTLTLTHSPGASVALDDARQPVATAPFVDLPVSSGLHTLRIRLAHAAGDEGATSLVDVEIPEQGDSIDLVALGPSLSLRDLDLSIAAARTASPPGWTPDAVAVTVVLCIWIVAAWFVSVPPAVSHASAPLAALAQSMTAALLGPMWLARASDLLVLAPRMKLVLPGAAFAVLVAAVSALWAIVAGRNDDRAATLTAFERVPGGLGLLLVRFEQWVLDALMRMAAALVGIVAWAVGRFDASVLSTPGEAVASHALRVGRAVESILGTSIGKFAWALVGLAAAVVAAHGFWSNR